MTDVIWSSLAVEDLDLVDGKTAQRIQRSVRLFATDRQGDVKKLAGRTYLWRLRVGDYRVIFAMSSGTITIARVLNRSRAYRGE